jgi:hypothetical protein
MPITRNGTNITVATFNGTPLTQIIYNGTTVWTSQTNYYTNGTQNVPWTTGFTSGTDGSIFFEASNVVISAGYEYANSTTNERTIVTLNTINLTNINTLYVDWECYVTGGPGQLSYLIASSSQVGANSVFNARVSASGSRSRQTTSLNVSGLSGNYYIRIHQRDGSTNLFNGSSLIVYNVWGV